MNLWLRVLWVFVSALFKPRMAHILDVSRLRLCVLPTDLDSNGHMNNGRYLAIMDLGRLDLILRTGMLRFLLAHKDVPILAAATLRYRLPLAPWQRYTLETRVVHWTDRWLFLEQRFIIETGPRKGAVAAIGLVKGSFYDRRARKTVPTQTLLDALGIADTSPPIPEAIHAFLAADAALQAETAPPGGA